MPLYRGSRFPLLGRNQSYVEKVMSYAPQAFWPLSDPSGSDAIDLVAGLNVPYSPTGVAYSVDGIGDGGNAVAFDGTNGYVKIGGITPGLDNIFDGDNGSALVWGKVDAAARWTDASTYRYLYHVRSALDATYYICFGKNTTNHQLEWRRRAGGAITSYTYTFSPTGPTDWFCMGMTWDVANTNIRAFVDGSYIGAGTGGTWNAFQPAAGTVEDGTSILFAGSLTLQEWIGRGALAAHWNTTLSDAAMEYLTKL